MPVKPFFNGLLEHGSPSTKSVSPWVRAARPWGLAPLVGAALVGICGSALAYEGWCLYRVQELRRAAPSVTGFSDPAGYAQRVACLTTATRLAPRNARLQVELALTYYGQYGQQRSKLQVRERLADMAQVVSELAALRPPALGAPGGVIFPSSWLVASAARAPHSKREEQQIERAYLVPALRCFLQARDLCPLLPEPQRCLASYADALERGDPSLAYWQRAARVAPYDPGLWYVCGEEALTEQPDQTWRYWQRSLALSDRYLSLILGQCAARLGPRQICDQVLPRDPNLLLKAALELYPQPTPERLPFLNEALSLLENQPGPLSAKALYVKASILCALDRQEDALTAYQAALVQEPRQVTWRFELARLFYQQNHLREARRELLLVLLQQPDNQDVRGLLTIVERKIAESL